MKAPVTVGYALLGDRIVHVSEVLRGSGSNCVCFGCGKPMLAKKGDARAHHFAHSIESNCAGGTETLLHRLAKELLSTAGSISFPAYVIHRRFRLNTGKTLKYESVIVPAFSLEVDGVYIEKRLGSVIPDLLITSGKTQLILEVAVSHKVDRRKLRQVRRLNLPMVEIELTQGDLLLARTALATRLQVDLSIKNWLFHPQQRAADLRWAKERRLGQAAGRRERRDMLRIGWQSLRQKEKPLKHSRGLNSSVNAWAERFNKKHGRYPSLAETKLFYRK